jgi:hypothetical protein
MIGTALRRGVAAAAVAAAIAFGDAQGAADPAKVLRIASPDITSLASSSPTIRRSRGSLASSSPRTTSTRSSAISIPICATAGTRR